MKRIITFGVIGVVVLAVLIQLIPYGHDHTNPSTNVEPQWNSPETRALAQRACFDCHSNQTVWPWYSNVAPMSWLIQHDVDEGRARLNFSEWNRPQRETRGVGRVIQRGSMPPSYYILLHPAAKLTPDEAQALINGLSVSLAQQ